MKEHYQKLERMYLVANIQKLMFETTTIKISEGESEVGLTVQEKYHHAGAAMHGAVYFKLLDDAAYFAANSVIEDVFLLTSSFNVNLIRPVVWAPEPLNYKLFWHLNPLTTSRLGT